MKRFLYVNLFALVVMIIYLLTLALGVTVMLYFSEEISLMVKIVVLSCICLVFTGYFYYVGLTKKVIISEHGVEYKSLRKYKKLSWDEIVEVGIVYYAPFPGATVANFMCFASKPCNTGISISGFSEDCIYMKHRRGLVSFIQRYWDKDIDGVDLR